MRIISIIEPRNERLFYEAPGVIDLDIHSEDAAVLLNATLSYKKNCCSRKASMNGFLNASHYWNNYPLPDNDGIDPNYLVGGGILVHGNPDIYMTQTGSVGIFFRDEFELKRISSNHAVIVQSVKNKLAEALKKFWDSTIWNKNEEVIVLNVSEYANGKIFNTKHNANAIEPTLLPKYKKSFKKNIREYSTITFTKEQYRCVYEHLKGRDKNKIIGHVGQETYDLMIGKKIEDQFVISAVEVLKSEIEKVNENYENLYREIKNEYEEELRKVRERLEARNAKAEKEKEQKIKDLNDQIKELIKSSVVIA